MAQGTKFIEVMTKIASIPEQDNAALVLGEVTSLNPLKIKISDKLELTESFLILSEFVKEKKLTLVDAVDKPLEHIHTVLELTTTYDDGHTHTVPSFKTQSSLPEIIIWRGLIVGDVVYMLRLDKGQQYLVLQRREVD